MKIALDSPQGPLHCLEKDRIEEGIIISRTNGRGRVMVPVQRGEGAPVQRLLNVMQPGSYVQPHLHPRPQASELVLVLQGAIRFVHFDEDGGILDAIDLTAGGEPYLVDIEPGVWHTMVALEPDSVMLEIKGGPYDPELDKVFADWAPEEGSDQAEAYLRSLL
jgi:cupin fold WbuC family metalloprotein